MKEDAAMNQVRAIQKMNEDELALGVAGTSASAVLFGVGSVDVCFGWNSIGNSLASARVSGGNGAESGGYVYLLFTDDRGG